MSGPKRDRLVGILLVLLGIGALVYLANNVGNLDQDDGLIDRGQRSSNCIGALTDVQQAWEQLGKVELFEQLRNTYRGDPVDDATGILYEQRALEVTLQWKPLARRRLNAAIIAGAETYDCPIDTADPVIDELPDDLVPPSLDEVLAES